MKYFVLSCSVILIFLSACTTKNSGKNPATPQSETVYGNLYVRFIEDQKVVKAEASLARGISPEKAIPLEIEGGVSFQSSGMTKRSIRDKIIRYETTIPSDYFHPFQFGVKLNGEQHKLELDMTPLGDFFLPEKEQTEDNMVVVAQEGSLSMGEQMVFMVSDAENKAASIIVEGPHPDIKFFLNKQQLSSLKKGEGKMYIVKKQLSSIKRVPFDVVTELEYYTKAIDVEI